MARSKDFYHLLLAYALVEVRALDGADAAEQARRLADLFHNVPEALCLPWTPERDERIYAQLQEKARAHGLHELLVRWEHRALRRLAQAVPQ